MSYALVVKPEAEQDIQEAAQYYQLQQSGLSQRIACSPLKNQFLPRPEIPDDNGSDGENLGNAVV